MELSVKDQIKSSVVAADLEVVRGRISNGNGLDAEGAEEERKGRDGVRGETRVLRNSLTAVRFARITGEEPTYEDSSERAIL